MLITVAILISLFAGLVMLDLFSDASRRRTERVDNPKEEGIRTEQRRV